MAKREIITAEYVRQIVEYIPSEGIFKRRFRQDVGANINARDAGKIIGCVSTGGYITISIDDILYAAHRLAWLYMTGTWPPCQIDHIDKDGGNNEWDNLRLADHSENGCNKTRYKTNKSGFKGVSWHNSANKWQASIKKAGKSVGLGLFENPIDAHKAYCSKARELHGKFARTE